MAINFRGGGGSGGPTQTRGVEPGGRRTYRSWTGGVRRVTWSRVPEDLRRPSSPRRAQATGKRSENPASGR